MKVVCILSDALRSDYPERYNMCFLKNIIDSGEVCYAERVIPSTGFCEINEYVTGKEASEHGMLTQITAKEDWRGASYSHTLRILDTPNTMLRKIPIIRYWWGHGMDWLLSHMKLPDYTVNARYCIPFSMLPFVEPTESKYEYDSEEFGGEENLFVWMMKHGISYDLKDFVRHNKVKSSNTTRLENLKQKIVQKKLKDFTLLYVGYGELAHFWGTDSIRFSQVMREYSERLDELYDLLTSTYHAHMIVLGDHGMIDVSHYVDAMPMLERVAAMLGLRPIRDFIYFVDSTMLRVWLKDFDAVERMERMLVEELVDHLQYDEDTRRYLDIFKPRYGDIILLMKAGHVLFPDFFNIAKNRGMHGYLSTSEGQAGTLIGIGGEVEPMHRECMKLSEVKHYIQCLLR